MAAGGRPGGPASDITKAVGVGDSDPVACRQRCGQAAVDRVQREGPGRRLEHDEHYAPLHRVRQGFL